MYETSANTKIFGISYKKPMAARSKIFDQLQLPSYSLTTVNVVLLGWEVFIGRNLKFLRESTFFFFFLVTILTDLAN